MGVHFICGFCASETRVELMTIINLNFQAISKSVAVEGISIIYVYVIVIDKFTCGCAYSYIGQEKNCIFKKETWFKQTVITTRTSSREKNFWKFIQRKS